MKKPLPIIIQCLLPLSAVAYLLYCLETYESVVHNDCTFYIWGYCFFAFIFSLVLWLNNRKTQKYSTLIFIPSSFILCGVIYVANKIPFCVVCDHVTAEDLGFLIHWIKPETPPIH